jgi:S-DNA-T family DNA segregation ATPase FtsK/SpoIIIE
VRLTSAELPPDLPGRGLVKGGTEVQVAWARGLPPVTVGPAGGPRPLLRLPSDHVEPREHGRSGWPADHVPVGVGGDDRSAVWLGPRHGPHLLVLGESLSGRTTALRTVVERLLAEDPDRRLAVVAQRRTAAWAWEDHPQLLASASSSTDVDAVLDAVESSARAGRPVVLAMDDAEGLALPGTVGDRLDGLLRTARDNGLRSVVAGRAADWPRLFDGWARYLTSLRTVLLLAPTPDSAVALDIRLPQTVVPMVPGRGFLVSGGRAEVLQVTRLAQPQQPPEPSTHSPHGRTAAAS